jgi:hypothetical protein
LTPDKYTRTKLVLAFVGLLFCSWLVVASALALLREAREPVLRFIHDAAEAARAKP